MSARIGSLFSGYGALDAAVEQVYDARTVWHSQYEPPTKQNPRPSQAPSKLLDYRFPGVPNHGDVTTIDWATVEPVDIITGGSPCQDVSAAGKRAGMRAGTRSGLWASMCDAIDYLRPRMVVWENVRGVLSAEADSALEPCPGCVGDGDDGPVLRALGRVLGDLADLGYDCQWHGLRAADVGAPHGRFRVFVVATDARVCGRQRGRQDGLTRSSDAAAGGSDSTLADADPTGLQGARPGGCEQAQSEHVRGRTATPDTSGGQRGDRIDWGAYTGAIRRWETVLGRTAPAPTELAPKGGQRLSPRFVEWMMGLTGGWVTDVPGISRNDQLKMLGNGVVILQAATALRRMAHLVSAAA